jgi:Domain of unknown function (DUF1987).
MDPLIIQKTDETPEVVFDKARGIFEISGRSLPEDSVEFFEPVFQWLEAYKNNSKPYHRFCIQVGVCQHGLFKNDSGYSFSTGEN